MPPNLLYRDRFVSIVKVLSTILLTLLIIGSLLTGCLYFVISLALNSIVRETGVPHIDPQIVMQELVELNVIAPKPAVLDSVEQETDKDDGHVSHSFVLVCSPLRWRVVDLSTSNKTETLKSSKYLHKLVRFKDSEITGSAYHEVSGSVGSRELQINIHEYCLQNRSIVVIDRFEAIRN
jgi:hypothetical protein